MDTNFSSIADPTALKFTGSEGSILIEAGFGANFSNLSCGRACCYCQDPLLLSKRKGEPKDTAGWTPPKACMGENLKLVEKGFSYLKKQIENAQTFGVPVALTSAVKMDTEANRTLAVASPKNMGLLIF
ncbi:hypothetical protein HPG69_015465 [Diceros bicornis minor]|uniref:Uncharacterized protein n=1 Tax=Diceros bicornis minor TaxID=77932 RepID=A0A7J7F1X8_DICBM|nr:hypothetical protein HPG69_015465 [Diceros bicornis minor]